MYAKHIMAAIAIGTFGSGAVPLPVCAPALVAAATFDGIAVEVPIAWDKIGDELAGKAASIVAEEIKKHGKDGLFWGLTGTLKPSSKVWYVRTQPVNIKGRAGYEMRFGLEARVKLDAGTGPFTTKVGAVETEQIVDVRFFPVVGDGKPVVDVEAEVVSATARKERQARTAHAEKLRDSVRAAVTQYLRENANRQVDVLAMMKGRPGVPADIDRLRIVNRIEVREKSLILYIGAPGNGGASLNVPASVSAPGQVTLYEHSNFRGKSITLSLTDFAAGRPSVMPSGWNDRVSSAKWETAPGVQVTLYEHNPPKGRTYLMRGKGQDANFSDDRFNDRASYWVFTR